MKKEEEEEKYSHITQRHHTNRLPDPESDSRCDAAIQALQSVAPVDVPRRVPHRHLLRPVRIVLLALHLHPDDLDGLIPRAQPASQAAGQHLLPSTQLLPFILPRHFSYPLLRQPRQPESATPVRRLPDCHGVDALVDPADALFAVDVHEGGEGAGGLDALGCDLVFCDFHGFHAGAESHGRVGLGNTASHTAGDAADEV